MAGVRMVSRTADRMVGERRLRRGREGRSCRGREGRAVIWRERGREGRVRVRSGFLDGALARPKVERCVKMRRGSRFPLFITLHDHHAAFHIPGVRRWACPRAGRAVCDGVERRE